MRGLRARAPEGKGVGPAAVEVVGLTHRYGRRAPTLGDIDFRAAPGEVLGVVGPNGAGKSTLLRILAGSLAPAEGEVRVLGGSARSGAVRRRIGVAPDRDVARGSLSGAENLRSLLGLRGVRRDAAAARASRWLARFGLEPESRRPVAEWSRGMRRRLSLAAAFAAEPDLLLLDEPTLALDPRGRGALIDALGEAGEAGVAAVIASNDVSFVEATADEALLLHGGRIAVRGDPAALVTGLGEAVRIDLTGIPPAASPPPPPPGLELVRRGTKAWCLQARDGSAALPAACSWALEAGFRLTGVRVHEPDLSDVFLRHTGDTLDPGPGAGAT